MKAKIIAASGLALLLGATAAQAQEGPFNSFYVGGQLGYDRNKAEIDVTPTTTIKDDWSGLDYGVFAGKNFQMGQGFFGVEGHFTLHGGKLDDNAQLDTLDAKHTWGAAARAGFLVTPQMAAYGKLGWERGRFSALDGENVEIKDTMSGFLYGGGIEYALTEQMSIRAEYTHTDFKSGPIGDYARDAVTAGVAFHF